MKVLCLLLALLMAWPIPAPMPQQETTSAIEYVTNNFDEFIAEYNKLDGEDCNATSIEYQTEIYVNDYDTFGYYLDFNGTNGFCIVTDEAVVDMYVTGDYPTLRQENEYMYDIMDGFFVKEDGEYVPFLQSALPDIDDDMLASMAVVSGDTVQISNVDQYIKKVYGSGYKRYERYQLPNFTCYSQKNLSVYLKPTNGGQMSEGNCMLSSIYATLAYLQKTGVYPNLPTGNTKIYTVFESVKAAAQKSGYKPRAKMVTVPTLYAKIREIAIEKYGYTINGLHIRHTDSLMEDVLKAYGYNINLPNTTGYPAINPQLVANTGFESTIKKNLHSGYPVVFNTYLAYGLGGHCITVIGYSNYRRTYDIGLTKIYRYAKFLLVADNHLTYQTSLDYTAYCGTLNYVYFKK